MAAKQETFLLGDSEKLHQCRVSCILSTSSTDVINANVPANYEDVEVNFPHSNLRRIQVRKKNHLGVSTDCSKLQRRKIKPKAKLRFFETLYIWEYITVGWCYIIFSNKHSPPAYLSLQSDRSCHLYCEPFASWNLFVYLVIFRLHHLQCSPGLYEGFWVGHSDVPSVLIAINQLYAMFTVQIVLNKVQRILCVSGSQPVCFSYSAIDFIYSASVTLLSQQWRYRHQYQKQDRVM